MFFQIFVISHLHDAKTSCMVLESKFETLIFQSFYGIVAIPEHDNKCYCHIAKKLATMLLI
jgi:hypothetical protein